MTASVVDTSPGVLTEIQDLMGKERTMTNMHLMPEFIYTSIDRIMAFNLAFITKLYEYVGNRIDFHRIGEDYGSQ